jgi:KDO2-lipid IV(A) lauroyltransferase
MRQVNQAFETAVRRDPANWFWVHNRWKPGKWKAEHRGSELESPSAGPLAEMENGG